MLYCQAILVPGAGLGDRLLPWARCRVFSYLNKIPMLSPAWAQIKVGPLLRGATDLRFYHNLFKRAPGDIAGIKRLRLEVFARKGPEPEGFNSPQNIKGGLNDKIIVYKDRRDCFHDLNGWDQFLLQEIRSIVRERWLKKADSIAMIPIGIHVRRGDFVEAKSKNDFYTTGGLRSPISWFIQSLKVIRESLNFPARAFVVSDGNEGELKELLKVDNVFFVKQGSAISDLLLLSRAKVLIGSGGSVFSAWASFLGQMPTISHPGQSLAWYKLVNRKGYYLGEFDPDSPPQPFVQQLKAIF